MDCEDRVLVVIGTGELELQLEAVELVTESREKPRQVVVDNTFGNQLAPCRKFAGVALQPGQRFEAAFESAALAQQGRVLGRALPESRALHLGVDLRQPTLESRLVKGTPEGFPAAPQAG